MPRIIGTVLPVLHNAIATSKAAQLGPLAHYADLSISPANLGSARSVSVLLPRTREEVLACAEPLCTQSKLSRHSNTYPITGLPELPHVKHISIGDKRGLRR